MSRSVLWIILLAVLSATTRARADEPRCQQEYVLRMGKLFTPEVFEDPLFDPAVSPHSPFCAADVIPTPDLLRFIDDSRKLRLMGDEVLALKSTHAIELSSCQADRDAVHVKWLACEATVCPIPPPVEVEVEPPWYKSTYLWGTLGFVMGSLATYGVVRALD